MTDGGRIAVLGASGQVGRALLKLLGEKAVGFGRPEGDLSAVEDVIGRLERLRPRALINAAAYTQVDRAESEKEAAWQINAIAPGRLAQWARSMGIPFVHYSTDYVFSDDAGRPDEARTESSPTAPINAYGASKLEGERLIEAAGGQFLIFRTSWVYDASGKNFVNTMLRLAGEREALSVVDDQIGAPTFARDLAVATVDALEKSASRPVFPSGIYHMTNAGETSWCGFTRRILEEARELGFPVKARELGPIPSSAYPTPAARPRNSRLSNEKLRKTFGIELRAWPDALHECLLEKTKSR